MTAMMISTALRGVEDPTYGMHVPSLLNAEIQGVMAMMRQNAKWAVVPRFTDDEANDDPLLQDFKALRRQIFAWQDWSQVDPLLYLGPFLEVVRSVETSGPITGMALSAIFKLVTYGVIGVHVVNANEAIRMIADATTHCRFEATDPGSDEVVLMKILQVLLACLRCPAGALLSDDDVCHIIQTCFRIGHQTGRESELLRRTARQIMQEMVRTLFRRLVDFKPSTASATQDATKQPQSPKSPWPRPALVAPADASAPATNGGSAAGPADTPSSQGALPPSNDIIKADSNHWKHVNDVGYNDAPPSDHSAPPYSVSCMVEVFKFMASLITPEETREAEDLCLFGLALVNAALETGGCCFAAHPLLLTVVQNELFYNLTKAGLSSNLSVLSFVCGILLNLYVHCREQLKLQLEAFFTHVLLRVAEGKGAPSYEQQEAAIECIVDFCRQASFMSDMYSNLDCDLRFSNVFEDLFALLSKNAFPVNSPLSGIHLLSLEGLLAIVHSIAERAARDAQAIALASGGSTAVGPVMFPLTDATEYVDYWTAPCPGPEDPQARADFLRRRKYTKRRLMVGVDHFNRDIKKGFEFLQSICLLPKPLESMAVAQLFRYTPKLNKTAVGEYLGDPGEFNIKVLKEFASMFDFSDMSLDYALRTFLDSFRLPGEAQKIARIMETFAEQYHRHASNTYANADAAYVLSYSCIMLNTDLHNGQVKKKMTMEEFIRNNRQINAGQDLPRDMLEELYHSIAKNEIKISSEAAVVSHEMSPSRWVDLLKRAKTGGKFIPCGLSTLYDRDMFVIMWGPSVAAISVVFDHTEDEDVLRECLDGFISIAKVAAHHRLEDVLDNLVISLCKFTTLLNPTAEKPSVAFGNDTKARMAAVTVFSIANKCGDYIRAGWRNILDCILRLHKLGLLPSRVIEQSDTDAPTTTGTDTPPHVSNGGTGTPVSASSRRSSSSLSKLIGFWSFDPSSSGRDGPTEAEVEALQRTVRCIEACRIDDIFSESKFLKAESLAQLAKALIWASGRSYKAGQASQDDEDTAVFCLDLLIAITLHNRDRILLLWPLVSDRLAGIIACAQAPGPLVEKAVFDLLKVCQRLLPYKAVIADELLRSLQLILKLDAKVADAYAERITAEVLELVRRDVTYIKSPLGWRTVCALLAMTAHHPDAAELGFEALTFLMADGAHITPSNFMPCLEAGLAFAEGRLGGADRSLKALDLLGAMTGNLCRWSKAIQSPDRDSTQSLIDLWLPLVGAFCRLGAEPRAPVRNHSLTMLQRVLLAAESAGIPASVYYACYDKAVAPMLRDVLELAKKRSGEYGDMGTSLKVAMTMLSKTFLQWLPRLSESPPEFRLLWLHILGCMDQSLRAAPRSEQLLETIPEMVKNMVLVMSTRGFLTRDSIGSTESLYEASRKVVLSIAPDVAAEAFGSSAAAEASAAPAPQ
eukprot:jgi/Chlat1/1228/Chrsp115S01684